MTDLIAMNDQIINIILQAFGYGLLAGFVFFFVFWSARLVLSIIRS